MRAGAVAGVAGPVVFTGAWIAGSLLQTGHGALDVQLSGLAAPDASDPWIMITGFLVLGGCTDWFGQELAADVGGAAPRLIQGAGVLTVAAGLLRRDHMELTSGPVSWHNEAHNVVSLVLYLDLVIAQLLLARRFAAVPSWRGWRRYLLGSGIATAVTLAVFLPNTTSPNAGVLQRIAVTIPLVAMTAVAARLAGRPNGGVPGTRAGASAPARRRHSPEERRLNFDLGRELHLFQGDLPDLPCHFAPYVVSCVSESEMRRWRYQEK